MIRTVNSRALADQVSRWRSARIPVGVCLDYDGTLTPIARRSNRARLMDRARRLLKSLAGLQHVEVVIVSGRRLNDVKRLVGLSGLSYVGLHGAEYQWRNEMADHLWKKKDVARVKRLIGEVKKRVPMSLGWQLDDKAAAAGFHHAGTSPELKKALLKAVRSACRDISGPWRLIDNRRTIEVLAVAVDKGDAIRWMRRRIGRGGRLVYFGDDRTDEHAFAGLGKNDVGVLVAPHARPTRALFRLVNVKAVHRFLGEVKRRGLNS